MDIKNQNFKFLKGNSEFPSKLFKIYKFNLFSH